MATVQHSDAQPTGDPQTLVDGAADRHRPAAAAPRRRLPPGLIGALVVLTGLLTVLGPYGWAELYEFSGFTTNLWDYYLWQLVPFLALAALAEGRWRMPAWLALPAALALAALYTHRIAQISADFGDGSALGRLPWSCTPAVLLVWAVSRHRALRAQDAERRSSLPLVIAWATAAALALGIGRALPIDEWATGETFALLFASIVVEALPFILLGASVSAALEVFVPDGIFAKASKLPLRLQLPVAIAGALAFPVCECGSVPVARRLILKGMHPSAGLAFMLAAPIVNPIVLFSTYTAYQGRGGLGIVAARAILGLSVALVAGLAIGSRRAQGFLKAREEHHHHHGGKVRAFTDHVAADFLWMGKFVVAGAALAAAAQTSVPQSFFAGVLTTPVLGGLVMMVAAFVLSLCSEADAFVAVSFIQFPHGPQLAFLVFGPILDIKLALLYGATFGRGFVLRLVLVTVPTVLLGSLAAGALL